VRPSRPPLLAERAADVGPTGGFSTAALSAAYWLEGLRAVAGTGVARQGPRLGVRDWAFGKRSAVRNAYVPPPPTDAEVGRLLATIRTRVLRLLRRRGVLGEPEEGDAPDPLVEASPALAGIASAAVQGRAAFGPRAGARVLQIGRVPGAPWNTSTGPRQAHLEGFDLHANVAVAAATGPSATAAPLK